MRINRGAFLRCLELVLPGVTEKEVIEQSGCVVFCGGKATTFNDEVSCEVDVSRFGPLSGAVQANPLITLLRKLTEEEVDIEQKDGEFLVRGTKRRAGVRCDAEVRLPIDGIECPGGDSWRKLPEEFSEGVGIVKECASNNEAQFSLSCVHVMPTAVEACDNYQMVRFPMTVPIERDVLIRAGSLSNVVGMGMEEMAETGSWIHFRNCDGLVLRCRRYLEEYPDLTNVLAVEGTVATLPEGLEHAVEKAEIFADKVAGINNVTIRLKSGKLRVEGRGVFGWYEEVKEVQYDGPAMVFAISPKLLVEICKRTHECVISSGRLLIDGGKFRYVSCLGEVAENV